MSTGPLPQRVNIRKAVTRQAHYHGTLDATQLPRFAGELEPDGSVELTVDFGEDDDGRQVVDVAMAADVTLQCQRCLQPLQRRVASRSRLGLVLSDEQAGLLPNDYEPWIAQDEVDLWDVAAEELALALPVVAYHDEGSCRPPASAVETGSAPVQDRPDNPFNVLSTLLDGDDSKEK